MSLKKTLLLIFLVLLVDQVSKIYIKTHFQLQERIEVFSWFQVLFVENDGMAWGAKLSDFGSFISDRNAKIILTSFRLFAIIGIGYWLIKSVINNTSKILIIAVALIFSGALGNIIDSVFYGIWFGSSWGEVASFLPKEGGYEHLLFGNVVDMLHFPMWSGVFPNWVPVWGGQSFTFFEPVFNIADMAITSGVGILIVFNKKAFAK